MRSCPKCTELFRDRTEAEPDLSSQNGQSYDADEDPASYFFHFSICVVCKEYFHTKEYNVKSSLTEENRSMTEKLNAMTLKGTSSRLTKQDHQDKADRSLVSSNCTKYDEPAVSSRYVDAATQTYIVNRPEFIKMAEAAFKIPVKRTNVKKETEPIDQLSLRKTMGDNDETTHMAQRDLSNQSDVPLPPEAITENIVLAKRLGPAESFSFQAEQVTSTKGKNVFAQPFEPSKLSLGEPAPPPVALKQSTAASAPAPRFKVVIKPQTVSPSNAELPSKAPPIVSTSTTAKPAEFSDKSNPTVEEHCVENKIDKEKDQPDIVTQPLGKPTLTDTATQLKPLRSSGLEQVFKFNQPVPPTTPSASPRVPQLHCPTHPYFTRSKAKSPQIQPSVTPPPSSQPVAESTQAQRAAIPLSSGPPSFRPVPVTPTTQSATKVTPSVQSVTKSQKTKACPATSPVSPISTPLKPPKPQSTPSRSCTQPAPALAPPPAPPQPKLAARDPTPPAGVPCWGCNITFSRHCDMFNHLESGCCASGLEQEDFDDLIYRVQRRYDNDLTEDPELLECNYCTGQYYHISSFLMHLEASGCGIDGGKWFLSTVLPDIRQRLGFKQKVMYGKKV